MSPGHIFPEQMTLRGLVSVKDGPTSLPLKFGQNKVSNRGFVVDVVIVVDVVVVLLLIPENYF